MNRKFYKSYFGWFLMKYIFIDFESGITKNNIVVIQPERVIWDDTREDGIIFICEKCFKEFHTRNLCHLEKCWIGWPIEGICGGSRHPSFMLFKIENEKEPANRRIIESIKRLSKFSKLEQGIDNRIPNSGLIGRSFFRGLQYNKFYCYVLFSYKNLIAYCWVQIYSSPFGGKRVVIRDIYSLPSYRHKGLGSEILRVISKEYGKSIGEMVYSMPLSDKLKGLLKKQGIAEYIGIQGENIRSLRIYPVD